MREKVRATHGAAGAGKLVGVRELSGMNFLSRLFGRGGHLPPIAQPPAQPPVTETLLGAFLNNELSRKKIDAEIETAQAKLKLEQLKIEMENLAATAEEKRKDAAFKAELRVKQREWAANSRGRKKLANGQPLASIPPFMEKCEDCQSRLQNRKPRHELDMLRHAQQGHETALDTYFAGKPNASSASTNLPN